jgi:hypothetical protein
VNALFPGWETTWRPIGWPFWVPFILQAVRALVMTPLLLVPRNHPRRELILITLALVGVTTDLVDGTVARAYRMTGLHALSYGDLTGDLGFWVGGLVMLRFKPSLRADLPPSTPESRRAGRWREVALIIAIVVLAAAVAGLIMNRTLTMRRT